MCLTVQTLDVMARLMLGVGGKVVIVVQVQVRAELTSAKLRVMLMGLKCASGLLASAPVGCVRRIARLGWMQIVARTEVPVIASGKHELRIAP